MSLKYSCAQAGGAAIAHCPETTLLWCSDGYIRLRDNSTRDDK
jgi:hypothetical protein